MRKNVGFLPGGGRKDSSEAVKEALEKFAVKIAAAPLPENQRFILSGPHLLQTSVFAKTLKAVAEVMVFAAGKPWEQQKNAVVRAVDLAAELKLKFEPGAADAFVARVGTDTRSLMSELMKLRDYLGSERHTIAAADIAEITSQGVGVEPVIWAVTDAIGERDLAKTLAAIKPFELENGFGVFMTTAIEKFFRQLVELKDAAAQRKLELATEGMAPFAVRKLSGFLRNWSLKELRVARFRFLTLREKVVTSSGSADQLVVLELVRTLRRAAR